MHASSSESTIFTATGLGGRAVSTAEVLRDAAAHGVAIMRIDGSNVGRLDTLVQASPEVKQEITRAVSEDGATVTVPPRESTIGGWTGSGYVIDEGSTIEYRISGGVNGAFIVALITGIAENIAETIEIVKCLGALDDTGDGIHLAEAAAIAMTTVGFSYVTIGPLLAVAAAPWLWVVAAIFLTFAIYLWMQAYSEGAECIGEAEDS
jgi:hypothetical protein